MPQYRKIGGLHWISWGRLRIAFCITRSRRILPEFIETPPETHRRGNRTITSITRIYNNND